MVTGFMLLGRLELRTEFLVEDVIGGSHQRPPGTILPALVSLGALSPSAFVGKAPRVPPTERIAVGLEIFLGVELYIEWLTLESDLTDKA